MATLVPVMIAAMVLDAAVMGPDVLNPHIELLRDQAAQMRHSAEQMRLMAAHLPLMMGIGFLLAPFTYGISLSRRRGLHLSRADVQGGGAE